MWYYYSNDIEYGPIEQKALEILFINGLLPATTKVRKHTWKHSKVLHKSLPFKDVTTSEEPLNQCKKPFPQEKLKVFTSKDPELGTLYIIPYPAAIGIILPLLLFLLFILIVTFNINFIQIILIGLFALLSVIGGGGAVWTWNHEKIQELQMDRKKLEEYQKEIQNNAESLKSAQQLHNDTQKKILTSHMAAIKELLIVNERKIQKQALTLAEYHLSEMIDWLAEKMTTKNYQQLKTSLRATINFCRTLSYKISADKEKALIESMKSRYEYLVRVEVERQEQARIQAQIREETQIKREAQRRIADALHQEKIIQAALDKALKQTQSEHNIEIERLKEELRKAKETTARAKSQAELTKAGHIYVISNVGSFGKDVFKIGMTRRIEPEERIKELSSASVPFSFNVHMMISCENAPLLENALHKELRRYRLNKVNPRKEFFQVDIETINNCVIKHHGHVDYIANPKALDYLQSLDADEEDIDFIDDVYEKASSSSILSNTIEL